MQTHDRKRLSILYVVQSYPQVSQTYIKTELEAVAGDYDVSLVCRKPPDVAYRNCLPHACLPEDEAILEHAEKERPDVLHTHYLKSLPLVGPIAARLGVPFTVRAHSFDVLRLGAPVRFPKLRRALGRPLPEKPGWWKALRWIRDDLCLGVLAFPFARPILERWGVPGDKIVDCWPVVAFDRFHDRSPNGDAVMGMGAAIRKKKFDDFLRLATLVPERRFDLYSIGGYRIAEVEAANRGLGGAVRIVPAIEPDEMRAEYKRHRWLVYTADPTLATVGWPMSVAEAQAAGVGVCMQDIRPDLREYLGPGILYRSIDEVAKLVRGPVPEEIREAGFEHARRSDVERHKHLLTDLWERARPRAEREA